MVILNWFLGWRGATALTVVFLTNEVLMSVVGRSFDLAGFIYTTMRWPILGSLCLLHAIGGLVLEWRKADGINNRKFLPAAVSISILAFNVIYPFTLLYLLFGIQ